MENKYEQYVGCYVKRFYTPFTKENIFQILAFRESDRFPDGEFLYSGWNEWFDVEDSVIIINNNSWHEVDERVVGVLGSKYKEYNGYNPY